MKLLALDTSTEACSVAVMALDTVQERFELGQKHSSRILVMVEELLAETELTLTQLDALAFGRGPGSFTGLRIGTGVIQGLAFGADLPVVPISSLAALAVAQEAPRVLTAFDARMSEIYWAAYSCHAQGQIELIGSECVVTPEQVPVPKEGDWLGTGSGWDRYHEVLMRRLGERVKGWRRQCYPRAQYVARLGAVGFDSGKAVSAEQALPLYMRDAVVVRES
ncbi:MAG: tRNA (adenosine(37)-N6)-threonylcarbamoyltransferase complex dimerization subunit type 1 TsaB [Acidiferrobacterales bacterium]